MFYFQNAHGKRTDSNNLSDIRRKAILYLRTLSLINVIDIKSDMNGYMGNIYKQDNSTFIWNPAKGKRLTYPDETYMGNQQSYIGTDGSLSEKIGTVIIPINAYRK